MCQSCARQLYTVVRHVLAGSGLEGRRNARDSCGEVAEWVKAAVGSGRQESQNRPEVDDLSPVFLGTAFAAGWRMRPCTHGRSLSLGHEDDIRGDVAAHDRPPFLIGRRAESEDPFVGEPRQGHRRPSGNRLPPDIRPAVACARRYKRLLPSPDHSAGIVTLENSLGGLPSSGTTAIRSPRGSREL